MNQTVDYAAFLQRMQMNSHSFLLRTCRGDGDDELEVREIIVPGDLFTERVEEARFAAYEAVCHLVDEAVTAEVEKSGVQTTNFLISKLSPGRYVYYADGKPVANVHVCVGAVDEKPQ